MITITLAPLNRHGWFSTSSPDLPGLMLCAPSLQQMEACIPTAARMAAGDAEFRVVRSGHLRVIDSTPN